ncbi:MAG: AMP-binding protein, partial [Myxococcales bacterium]|nr:AMP-binding protein [Myxococcales bacterium]
FALGGDSLLTLRVVAEARRRVDLHLQVRDVFLHPTVARLAAAVRGRGVEAAIPALPRDGRALPASFGQARLWVLEQLSPGSARYNMAGAFRLDGPVDPKTLAAALDRVAWRHAALRTTFEEVDGALVQVEHPAGPVLEVTAVDEADLDATIRNFARRPFDLHSGPLARVALLQLGPNQHALLVNLHHAVADGWSLAILVRDLGAAFQALPLPAPRLQYADFAAWQRDVLSGPRLERELDGWRDALAGIEPLPLATDRPRPPVFDEAGDEVPFAVDAATTEALAGLGRAHDASLFMVLLAAFDLLLSRHAGDCDDVVVGAPVAGRTHPDTAELVGFFVNTLALRGDLRGDPTWIELLARVRETCRAAFAHQDAPFERVVDALAVPRDLSRAPVFQVLFVFQSQGEAVPAFGDDVRVTPLPASTGTTKVDLRLELVVGAEGLRGRLGYATALFDRGTIEALAERLGTLLRAVVAQPEARLSALPLWTADELRAVERFEVGPAADEPALSALLEGGDPEAIAVISGGETLTYAQLDAEAAAVADRLLALGIGPEARVGICARRGPRLIA